MKYLQFIFIIIINELFSFISLKHTLKEGHKFLDILNVQEIPEEFLKDNELNNNNGIKKRKDLFNIILEDQYLQENDNDNSTDDDTSKEKDEDYDNNESADSSKVNIKCLWVHKYNVYSLQELQKKKDDDYHKDVEDGEVVFNFCQNTNNAKELEGTVLWKRNKRNDEPLIKVGGSIDGNSKSDQNKWSEITDDTGDKGLFISLTKGEKCKGKEDELHQTYLRIVCDSEVKKDEFLGNINFKGFTGDSCTHKIEFRSLYGCALTDLYLLKKIMNKYWYLFALILFGIGGFLCFYGHRLIWLTAIFVSGIFFCFLISIIVLNFILSLIKTEASLWILLVVGLLVGLAVGFLIKKKTKAFVCFLGASMGYSAAIFVYQIIQSFITWNPQILYYITIGICVIVGILLSIFFYNVVLIVGTAIVGGYLVMRGVTIIFGNYIDEGQFVDLIKNREFEELKEIRNGWVFAYLGLWLVFIGVGLFIQYKIYKKKGGVA